MKRPSSSSFVRQTPPYQALQYRLIKPSQMIADCKSVHLENGDSSATIYLHGATVTSWKKGDKELLFLSEKALLDGSKPIRGGIPLVFPQFGTGPIMAGQHGFARTRKWLVASQTESSVKLVLKHSEETLKQWPHEFELQYEVVLKQSSLTCRFEVKNCGQVPFDFTALLHTYFATGNISSVSIEGLQGLKYRDKLQDYHEFTEERPIINSINCEVDRNYLDVPGKVLLESDFAKFELSSDFKDLVVWNPWIEKSKAMADFDDEEYKKMICLEFGHVEAPVSLAPGSNWSRTQEITLL